MKKDLERSNTRVLMSPMNWGALPLRVEVRKINHIPSFPLCCGFNLVFSMANETSSDCEMFGRLLNMGW